MTFKLKEDNELEFIEFLHNPFNPCKSLNKKCADIECVCIQKIDDKNISASIKVMFINNLLEQTFDIILKQEFELCKEHFENTEIANLLFSNFVDKLQHQNRYEWVKEYRDKTISEPHLKLVLKCPYIPDDI